MHCAVCFPTSDGSPLVESAALELHRQGIAKRIANPIGWTPGVRDIAVEQRQSTRSWHDRRANIHMLVVEHGFATPLGVPGFGDVPKCRHFAGIGQAVRVREQHVAEMRHIDVALIQAQ